MPILLNLERIVDGGTFDNLIAVTICFLIIFDGMLEINIANKVLCFGVDTVIIFQCLKTGVIVHPINKHYPFIVRFIYIVHRCNIVV